MTDGGGRLNYRRSVASPTYDASDDVPELNSQLYMGASSNGAIIAFDNSTKATLGAPSHYALVGTEMLQAKQSFFEKWGNSSIQPPAPNFYDGFLYGHIRLTRGDRTVVLDQDIKGDGLQKEFTSSASNNGTDMIVAALAALGVKPPLRFYWDKSFNHLKIPDDLTAEFVDRQGKVYPLEFPKTVDPRDVKLTPAKSVSVPLGPDTLRECGIAVPAEKPNVPQPA